jgi:thiol-disulfide isomerase/thioredoxin
MLVTEASFARHVLRAPVPVVVCFGTRACQGRKAMAPALEGVAAAYQGRLEVAMVVVDRAPLVADQYGITASPTLVAFHHGDPQGRVVGFVPSGLVNLFAEDVVRGAVSGDRLWSPVEERFEDAVVVPLLRQWDFTFRRQVPCTTTRGHKQHRGRVDFVVYDHPLAQPLTVVENKRHVRGDQDLQEAAVQAAAYARGLWVPSFVIAAPRGLWVYRRSGEHAVCVRHFTSLELHQKPGLPQQLLLQLRSER